jgi:hypothetical protein
MRSFRWRYPVLVVVALALLGALWIGWQSLRVYQDLSDAADDAARLQVALEAGNDAATDRALEALREHSSSAADRTDGATWSFVKGMPVIGDDATGVQAVSEVLADLSDSRLDRLATMASDLEALAPRDGQIPVDTIRDLQEPVASALVSFTAADERLADEDPDGYVGPLGDRYRDLASRVSDAAALLDTADNALRVLPGMLGEDGARDYLLVFQNNAEIRATGGLPGALSVVNADNGQLEMTRQVAANSFGQVQEPVLPLSPAEAQIYNDQLGQWFLDANFTPDFPRVADLMKARWEQVYPEKLDGVIAIDPVALSYILRSTGPVTVGDTVLKPDNAVDELMHQAYLRYPDPKDQDEWFRQVARAVFDEIANGVNNPPELIRAVVRAADEGRVFLHSYHRAEQDELTGTQIAGELSAAEDDIPQVGFYLNDGTGAKMSYFLRHDVEVRASYCTDGVQGLTGRAYLLSDAPENAAELPDYVTGGGKYGTEPGSQMVAAHLYGPEGGTLKDVELNGEPIAVDVVNHDGRPVANVILALEPQFTVDLTWRMTTGEGETGDPEVSVTTGVEPETKSSVVSSACG